MMPVSVLVLTFNEDKNIANCLRSIVNWSDDVVVLDSFSTDHTRDIVLSHPGVRFLERAFDGYAKQRNYALQEIEYKHPWLLMIDADEQLTPELAKEITEAMSSVDSGTALFRMRRKDYFMGKWLRHSSGYPTWFGRLMRIGSVWIDREINEEYHTSDKIVELDGHLLHYPFNKGIKDWIEKHNRYSTMEAELLVSKQAKPVLRDLFAVDSVKRRVAIKAVVYSLPFRPLVIFCLLYFFRLGFLDGKAGYLFCRLRMMYERMISIKVLELNRRREGESV